MIVRFKRTFTLAYILILVTCIIWYTRTTLQSILWVYLTSRAHLSCQSYVFNILWLLRKPLFWFYLTSNRHSFFLFHIITLLSETRASRSPHRTSSCLGSFCNRFTLSKILGFVKFKILKFLSLKKRLLLILILIIVNPLEIMFWYACINRSIKWLWL